MTTYQIGIDIGGTHTDAVVLVDDGSHVVAKAPSTPHDYSDGVLASLEVAAGEMGTSVADLLAGTAVFVNGSTVATNVIAQLSGARTGVITTAGFEDTLRIARSARRNGVFDFHRQVPPPQIVPRTLVRGVAERVDYRGEVVVPLQRAEAERAVQELLDAGVETIAVCLLWSFRNAAHEQLIGEAIRDLAPDMHHSLSCEVHPVIREYERMVTTVFNSYAGPRVTQYTTRLAQRLEELGLRSTPMIMHSEGGYMSFPAAGRRPVSLILSGPAAGAIGARQARRGDGRRERHHGRHGRHELRHRPRAPRPGAEAAARAGRRLRDRAEPRRRRRHRLGRRLDRVDRRPRAAERRAAERGRRSRARLLRARRHGADRHRRAAGARPPLRRTASWAAASTSTSTSRATPSSGASRPRSGAPSRRPRSGSTR